MTRELGRGEGWGSRGGQARPADRPAADLSTPHLWALQPTKPDDPLLGMKFDAFPRPSSSSASPPTPSLSRLPNSNNLNRLRLPLAYVFRSPTSSARTLPFNHHSTIYSVGPPDFHFGVDHRETLLSPLSRAPSALVLTIAEPSCQDHPDVHRFPSLSSLPPTP